MKNKSALLTSFITAALAVIFSVVMLLCAKQPHFAPNSSDLKDGVAAVRPDEMDGLSRVQYANFTPDEFALPLSPSEGLPSGQLVELADFACEAARGTYQFAIVCDDSKGGLDEYKTYDGYRVTVFIPHIFSAAVIYVDNEIVAKLGEIADYNYADYNESYIQAHGAAHENETDGVFLDIVFAVPSSRAGSYSAAKLITIHYEADGNRLAGMRGVPLIGSYSEVHSYRNGIDSFYIFMLILAAIATANFAFLFIIKRSAAMLPHLGVALAGTLLIASRIFLNNNTHTPYIWGAMTMGAAGLLSFAASLSMLVKIRKFPVWTVTAGVTLANSVISFVLAYVSPATFVQWHIYRVIMSIVICVLLFAQTILYALKAEGSFYTVITPVLIAELTAQLPFMALYEVLYPTSPALYLFAATMISTMVFSVMFFVNTERNNRYLTQNLYSEVQRRTENLKSIADEQERLLRYLSHDMRKPVASIRRFAGELLTKETDDVKRAQLKVICDKAASIEKELSELQKYAKVSFTPEQSHKYDIYSLLDEVYRELRPDCEASDIILHPNTLHLQAYYRQKTLSLVLKNLVFNCIEHAECHNVYLAAQRASDRCVVTVTDDGIGIEDADAMFDAYTGSGSGENLGLGLYICRDLVKDMGGELSYKRENDKTVFTVTLPPA